MARAKTRKHEIALIANEPDSIGIAVTGAGDGLSKSLEIDERDFPPGVPVHVVLECLPNGIKTTPVKDTDGGYTLVYVLKAGRATFVDADLVEGVLDEQDIRLEKAAGIQRLPLDEEPSQN